MGKQAGIEIFISHSLDGKPLSNLFERPILPPINLRCHFDNIGLQKITHIIGR